MIRNLFSPEAVAMSIPAAPTDLRRRLRKALQWIPGESAARVAFDLDDTGRVTLEGSVPTYADKCTIAETVKRVAGVTSVRNRLEVRLTIADYRPDATLERVLHDLFEFLARMPPERPRATVVDGWVTLDGMVLDSRQKQLIENAVREVAGIRGITNRLTIRRN